jgi:tetratricopeptide (TPR) repeat protein
MVLAMAVGFQRASQFGLALPLARQAAAKLDTPAAHLALGDLLLAIAEIQPPGEAATRAFNEAIGEYDSVLKKVPDSIEAVNNKAWILHSYLKKSNEALKLAAGLRKRAVPAALPAEFFDTLGSIQQAVGQPRDAEDSYLEGLKKDPKNPTLNLHYGKLLIADASRAAKARIYLDKAAADRGRLSPAAAREAASMLKGLNGTIRGN